MPVGGRKTPFSGKKKKEQLKAKRDAKAQAQTNTKDGNNTKNSSGDNRRPKSEFASIARSSRIPLKPNTGGKESNSKKQRYALLFQQMTAEEIVAMKEKSRETFDYLGEEALYFTPGDVPNLPLPKRPLWDQTWSKNQLEEAEAKSFRLFVDGLMKDHPTISYFEMNLETWRQLWRVLEKSEILLLIADIRYPIVHVPIALIEHIKELGKHLVIVLNKIDLVSPELTARWVQYLESQHPGIKCVPFASYAGCKALNRGRRGKLHSPVNSCLALHSAINQLVKENKIGADLSSWEQKIHEDGKIDDDDEDDDVVVETSSEDERAETAHTDSKFLTVGMVGHPNVGKSSVLNALIGKKVVSVSRTPGHTKYFQTYFLTKNLRLCDSPGIVFPTMHPRELQVISGSFPVSQLRVPLSVVQYVAERVPLPQILSLEKIEKNNSKWSTYEICQSFAELRGYMTAMAGRPDVNRAANQILRMALDGRTVCVSFKPPREAESKVDSSLLEKIIKLRGEKAAEEETEEISDFSDDGDDEDEGDNEESGSEKTERQGVAPITNKFASLMTEDSDDASDENND